MTVSFNHLTTGGDTNSNGAVYNTASIAPAASRVLFLAVLADGPSASNPTAPTITGLGGLTWTLVRQTPDPSNGVRTIFLFRATTGTSAPAAGALTLTFSISLVNCQWFVYEASGVDTVNPVVQTVEERLTGNTATATSLAWPAALTAGNGALVALGTNVNAAITPGSGWSSGGQSNLTAPTQSLIGMYANAGATPIAATWAGGANTWTLGVEVKAGSAAPADTTAPTVPASVTATANNPVQVTVSWAASTDAVGVASYQVKRGGVVIASAVTGTTFVDVGVSPATTYSYTVSAVDAAGNRSADSSPASATTAAAPTGSGTVTRVGSNGGWGGSTPIAQVLPTGTTSGDFLVARVQTGKSGTITTPNGWTFRDSTQDPDAGDFHYLFTRRADGSALDRPTWTSNVADDDIGYIVVAARGVDYANPVNAFSKAADQNLATTAPAMVTSVANCLVLNFIGDDAGSTDNIDPRFTPNDTTNWTDGLNIGLSPDWQSLHSAYRTQAAAGTVPGLTWTQHVAAATTTNGYVNHQIALAPAAAPPDSTPPTVPTNVSASAASPTSVTVSWTASTDTVGVTSYRVRRGGVDLSGATAVIGTSFVDTTVVGGTAYSYTVSAVDGAGNRSAESSAANVTTPSAATAPTVGAGVDVSSPVGTAFARTATENANGSAITSRAWTIVSGPAGVGTTIGTAAALSWTPTAAGTYVLRYSATNAVGTGSDDVQVTATAVQGTLISRWVGAVTDGAITVAVRTSNATSVRLAVSTSSAMTSPVYSSTATPDANGNSKVTVTGLAADTTYTYAIEMNGSLDAARATARTFPKAGVATSFQFAFGSCVNATDSEAFTRIKAKDPDLFVHLGDFRYLNPFANDVTLFQGIYNEALGAASEAPLYRSTPTAYVWSDHDYAGGSNAHSGAVPKPAAQATYRQYVPHYTLPATDGGIYQTFVLGRARFILTDLRSYRSAYDVVDGPTKTAMGATQKQWFKDTITASTEKIIFWGSELPWVDPVHTGDDKWGAYDTERQELASFIAASGKKVVIISGDLHGLAADNGTNGPGGITNWVAAPFNNSTNNGNGTGPWSDGYAFDSGVQRYYGWVNVTDNGTTLTATFTGYDTTDVARITHSVTVSDSVPLIDGLKIGGSSPSAIYIGSQAVSKVYVGSTQVWP